MPKETEHSSFKQFVNLFNKSFELKRNFAKLTHLDHEASLIVENITSAKFQLHRNSHSLGMFLICRMSSLTAFSHHQEPHCWGNTNKLRSMLGVSSRAESRREDTRIPTLGPLSHLHIGHWTLDTGHLVTLTTRTFTSHYPAINYTVK